MWVEVGTCFDTQERDSPAAGVLSPPYFEGEHARPEPTTRGWTQDRSPGRGARRTFGQPTIKGESPPARLG